MSYAHITIDGDTILDGELALGTSTPPATLRKYLTPTSTPQPGLKAVLLALAEAAAAEKDITANLRNRPTGFDLTIDYGPHQLTS